MKINLKTGKRARIEMLPLIDIVFLLLVFFIYAMLSMAVHRGLPVTLPSSSTAKIDKQTILSVTIKQGGQIYLDKNMVSLDKLDEVLVKLSAKKKESGILLFADGTVTYQEIFRVMDQIRISGITRISLQAEADQ